jgi:hypothetical protein
MEHSWSAGVAGSLDIAWLARRSSRATSGTTANCVKEGRQQECEGLVFRGMVWAIGFRENRV